jgi:predicted ester cyclase
MVTQFLTDRKTGIVDLVAEGDKVLLRSRVSGTNNAGVPWIGAEANGLPYDFESWSVYTIRDGNVVEHVGLNDVWLFAIQAGGVTPPRPPVPA